MTKRVHLPHPVANSRLPLRLSAISAAALVACAAPVALEATAAPGEHGQVLALAPSQVRQPVTDEAGVLSDAEVSQLSEQISELQTEQQRLLYIIYSNDLSGLQAQDYAQQVINSRGQNTAAFVVNVGARDAGVYVGGEWNQSDIDRLYDAAYARLAADDFPGAAQAVVEEALNKGHGDEGAGGTGWLLGGGAALAAAGGGIWAYSRRKTKKQSQATLTDARSIDPADTRRLGALPLETLEERAREELVSTDESIRRGKEELQLAQAEFGAERTRQFTRAMNHSTATLRKAFDIRQRLDDSIPESESQRRQMLVDIISSCGQADRALDEQAEEFAEMRNLLATADSKLDELTQRVVDLRARRPQAQATWESLQSNYSAEMLESIADNVEMAAVSLDEADKDLERARAIAAQPAGQQGGLIDAIRSCEHALEVANRLLTGVENAETNIATAKSQLGALIAEVDEELAEAQRLKQQGQSQGTAADWAALDELVGRAQRSLERARTEGEADPLGCYTELATIDTEVDQALDRVREVTSTHARQLALLDQQLNAAAAQIQAAEDLISSRGRLIGASARTALADAQRLHAQALQYKKSDIQRALDSARQALAAAQAALQRAKSDIDDYRRSQRRAQAGNVAGNVVTGMVIGQMLGGGNRGGFGGGFGGSGFGGGGGFSGGGRGGAF